MPIDTLAMWMKYDDVDYYDTHLVAMENVYVFVYCVRLSYIS